MSDDDIQLETHFKDLIKANYLFDENERLPGPDGTPGQGLTFREAVPLAQHWWDTKARFMCPDYGKPSHALVIRSGIMMGLPWNELDQKECLRVLANWYANIGVHSILEQRSSSDDADKDTNIAQLREKSAEIMPVLSSESTHKKVTDDMEAEVWKDEYKQMELEDKILQSNGEAMKGNENGELDAKN